MKFYLNILWLTFLLTPEPEFSGLSLSSSEEDLAEGASKASEEGLAEALTDHKTLDSPMVPPTPGPSTSSIVKTGHCKICFEEKKLTVAFHVAMSLVA